MRKLAAAAVLLVIFLFLWLNASDGIQKFIENSRLPDISQDRSIRLLREESVVIDTVKNVGPSVVTIVVNTPQGLQESFDFGPFGFFDVPEEEGTPESRNIGSGFIVSSDGLIITNKHVVSRPQVTYQIITDNDKRYEVRQIYRDPLNDIAILKVNPNDHPSESLKPVVMGDSSRLEVGQFVIAIGTALGEFRNTVTTGVISGLGRGITAGSVFQGFVEKLDNVIQTDAAINPGNSGGPLLNSEGEVIGVNTAIASSGQNIGFALPINSIKESLENFNRTGQFNRPFLGVSYRMLDGQVALLNNVPQGAMIEDVVEDSPADSSGIAEGDIIYRADGKNLNADFDLSEAIASKKVGENLSLSVWRDEETIEVTARLTSAPNL